MNVNNFTESRLVQSIRLLLFRASIRRSRTPYYGTNYARTDTTSL